MTTALRRVAVAACIAVAGLAGAAGTASAQTPGSTCAENVIYCIPDGATQSAGQQAIEKLFPKATVKFSAAVGGGLVYTVTFPPLSVDLSPAKLAKELAKRPATVLYLPNGGKAKITETIDGSRLPGVKSTVKAGGRVSVQPHLSREQAAKLKRKGRAVVTYRIVITDATGTHVKTIRQTIKLDD
jgi:hypothetical protein